MVYIKPVLASAVAFTTLISTTSALPATVKRDQTPLSSVSSNAKRNVNDGPVVVQAKSIRRGYVGGGERKGLKQAPLVKASKLFRSKRDIVEARDTHVHEHIHEHDDDDDDDHHHHHHHDDDHYDHHHSEHYNYHHGLIHDDDHEHHHHHDSRDLVNVAALNFNSPSNNKIKNNSKKINKINKSKKIGKINKCKGSHFHCNNHKRDENTAAEDADTEGEEQDENRSRLIKRRKNSSYKKHKNNNNNGNRYKNNGWKKNNQKSNEKVVKAQTEISANGLKRTPLPGNMSPALEVRHYHHHDDEHVWEHEHDHDHEHYHEHDHEDLHEHIHSHEHKRDLSARHEDEHVHMHIHEDGDYDHDHHHHHHHHHNDKRRHDDHDSWLDDMTYERHYHDGHAHIHLHEHDHGHYHGYHHHHHDKRQETQSGIPGFVEVANTLAGTSLAKSVAGLVFSKGPDPNASGFLLGTSETQSTQFYLVPSSDESTMETSQSVNASASSPEDNIKTYQLRIPVLDSKNFKSSDYCATFDILPPSPMTMAPCKKTEGFSQEFKYNQTTGELTPVYPPTSTQPKPMNAAVRMSEPQVMAAKFPVTGNQVPVPADASMLSAATGMPADSASSSTGSSTVSSDAAATTGDSSDTSSSASTETSLSAAAPQSTASATPEDGTAPADAPKVSLFFIPASTYAQESTPSAPATTPSTPDSASSTPSGSLFNPTAQGQTKIVTPSEGDSTSEDWGTESDEFSPSDNQAKVVTPSGGANTQDWSNTNSDSGVVTTTVVVTSTMDASSPQATSADWNSTDGSSGHANADMPSQ